MKETATHRLRRPGPSSVWVLTGIVILALSLRTPIVAPTAVISDIQADTGLSAPGAGLLTGIPVLLFALATPLASRVIRGFGAEAAVVLCLAGVLAGTALRSAGPTALVLAGTVLIGTAITVGNIVVPVIIRRDVPFRQISAATGAYTAAMNVGSMAALLGTPLLAGLVGWRWAVASSAVATAAGLAYWLILGRPSRRSAAAAGSREPAHPEKASAASAASDPRSTSDGPGAAAAAAGAAGARNLRITVLLTLTFCGQSASYYATTTWLPLLLAEERGLGAGAASAAASLFQVAAIAGAFGVPLLARRTRIQVPMAVVAACWIALPVGLLAAPGAYLLWSLIGGIAQGGGFTAIFSIVPAVARSDADAASASARIQGGGYLAATAAPPLAGWLHTATGGWTGPLLLVLAATLVFTVCGLLAAWLAERRT
ncbi:putative transporter YycB [Arthrobacter saudimassiliensis]|uniref:Putative transporter YycB n=1 Tax=Arthrobacter saudimassiliensis TaxID=1461584 RepID=A0A078MUI9_9MICC|nr:putative transporter YycB [Arthrobacter saudimassiliensis]